MAFAFLFVSTLGAVDESDGFGLPSAVSESQFDALREHSPFTRVLDLSETIQLTGIAVINGEQMATVRDRQKEKSYVISGEPNKEGWKMVEVDSSIDLENVSATISVNGGELVTVQFDEKQLRPEAGANGTASIKVVKRPDKRPPPTKDERRKFGEWVRGRMSKMTEAQRKRVGQIMQEKMKGNSGLTDRQKGEVFIQVLDYVESGKK